MCVCVCVVRGIKYDYDIIIIFEVLMYTFLCVLLLQSAMCSPLSVRYGATKMTGIIIIINLTMHLFYHNYFNVFEKLLVYFL